MEPTRKFKIIVNSKECGTCSGPTPSVVAKNVVKKLCGSSSKAVRFSLKECKRGCERMYGPYQGRMEKLDRPYKRDGKTITYRVVCKKVLKMRGGVLNETTRSLDINDFKVEFKPIEDVPFLKLQTFGKLGTLGFGSTKEQYGFFNPQLSNTDSIYYQYVVIRKKDKSVVFKNSLDNNIDISKIDTPILLKLFNEIKKEIQTKRIKNKGFDAKSIVEELEKYLKNKISTNLKNKELSIKLFKIEEKNPPEIKYFSFGERTSKLFGNKTQYIFFNIVEELSGNKYYKYVVIRDKNQKISLKKKVFDENNNFSITNLNSFNNIKSNNSEEGQLILEKLLFDINNLITDENHPERSNFATTIRKELVKYTDRKYTDDIKLNVNDFTCDDYNEYDFKIKYINGNICIFFNDFQKDLENKKNRVLTVADNDKKVKYDYLYVMFLNKKQKINFRKLIFDKKNNPIIIIYTTNNYLLLEFLYEKINSLCDSDNDEENNKNILNILYSLEKYLYNDRSYLKSRDFYITHKQQNETIRIVNKDNKTFIFFKRYKGKSNFILYEYVIIIDENIEFKRIPDPFILIRNIEDITIDNINELFLMLLYEELLEFYNNIEKNINKNKLLKKHLEKLIFVVLSKYKEIEKLYKLKKKVENVLTSHIKNNKIRVNGNDHNIQYKGEFTFDFFDNLKESKKIIRLEEFLRRILAKENINMITKNKFKFKPIINSIKKVNNNKKIKINTINLLNIAAPIINGNPQNQ
jgi:hypothetical protein